MASSSSSSSASESSPSSSPSSSLVFSRVPSSVTISGNGRIATFPKSSRTDDWNHNVTCDSSASSSSSSLASSVSSVSSSSSSSSSSSASVSAVDAAHEISRFRFRWVSSVAPPVEGTFMFGWCVRSVDVDASSLFVEREKGRWLQRVRPQCYMGFPGAKWIEDQAMQLNVGDVVESVYDRQAATISFAFNGGKDVRTVFTDVKIEGDLVPSFLFVQETVIELLD